MILDNCLCIHKQYIGWSIHYFPVLNVDGNWFREQKAKCKVYGEIVGGPNSMYISRHKVRSMYIIYTHSQHIQTDAAGKQQIALAYSCDTINWRPCWQCCRHWWHRRSSLWQSPVPMTTKLASWPLSIFSANVSRRFEAFTDRTYWKIFISYRWCPNDMTVIVVKWGSGVTLRTTAKNY